MRQGLDNASIITAAGRINISVTLVTRIVNLIFDLYRKYGYNSYIWIDGANRAFVKYAKDSI